MGGKNLGYLAHEIKTKSLLELLAHHYYKAHVALILKIPVCSAELGQDVH